MRRLMQALAAIGLAASAPAPIVSPVMAGRAATNRIPVEAFAALPFVSDPALSPDGTKIAARTSVDGHSAMAVWDLPTRPDQQPKVLATGNASFQWAGNGRLLLNDAVTVTLFGINFQATTFKSYDLATGGLVDVGGGASLLGDVLIFIDPAGGYILRTKQTNPSSGLAVVRVDLGTGNEVEVQPAVKHVGAWYPDSAGVVRAGLEIRGKRTALLYRRTAAEPLRRIETHSAAMEDESMLEAIRFVGDTDQGFVVSNARTGRFGVYRYDFVRNEYGQPVWEHPEVDALSVIAGVDGELDGVRYVDDQPHVHWLNADAVKIQQLLDRSLPGKVNLISGTSRDRNKVLVWSGAADDPGTYYVLDRETRKLELFASPHDQLIGAALAPVKPIRYRAGDGLTIRAYLTLPIGGPAEDLPLVVVPHGGPFLRDVGHFDALAQFLASRGYAVLQPNFRGSTGFGRQFVEHGYGQLGTGMIDDMSAGVDWLAAQGTIDPKRVCMVGMSYGGYASLWAATRDPGRYRCAVSMAGISDLRAMLKYSAKLAVACRYAKDWTRRVQGAEKQDLKAISPLQQADRLVVPVLIAHGELDVTVPPNQSRLMVAALQKRGKSVESVFYPSSGHDFNSVAESTDLMKRIEAFLAKHNPV